ncbi:Outer membrane protein beta-barrel domain-containing protein [Nonlabens sp. Hel1_33_55]|uniref:porin family protein n=1 Tax=Nonlabens sp. Hel1_33_55 TaxID=1336802 RepID=UPI000875CC31|nr:porin family protein [Nonlabens sp. Hel1_33_55]SCX90042.1 Outer membrane protein beta-barrel domain-containing protein [Nonlabens sp. Hel1_33_55]
MKKVLAIAVVALGSIGFAQAQEIDFGVQVGYNIANLQGDDVEDVDARNGINIGLTGEYEFGPSFGLLVGAIYSQQGAEGNGVTLKLDYINVPVLAKFYLGGSGFSIDAGPQIGFNVKDEVEVDRGIFEGSTSDFDAESIDLSIGGGLTYKFREGSTLEGLSLGGRYMVGVSNIYEDNDTFSDDVTNQVFSINLGYKF